eukprot:CAMPEP_0168473942 /NCGR_PEP_ID=MMETSP0228-20121227/60583_1 /TAXON_ID=133427 /ORGANISM="Protoceratium reticulatum, Strain CCCM 535 (=CCMP 1889)" /LENGTH=117 /DNA_ID=CAMNT_0008489949 /DNA_START=27 /DNA_END=380 /DNA_ORIENTATION=-
MHYYGWFDTAIVTFLTQDARWPLADPSVAARCFVIRSSCRYFSPVTMAHSPLQIGLRPCHVGKSSFGTQLAAFSGKGGGHAHAAAEFWHCWVDTATERPCAMPAPVREALEACLAAE